MEKQFFNKGFISDLILLGKADKQYFSRNMSIFFFTHTYFYEKIGLRRILAIIAKRPTITWVQNSLDNFGHIGEPSY